MGGSILVAVWALAPPEEIRRKAEEILSRPEYDVETPQPPESLGLLARFLRWILEKLQAFFDVMGELPDVLRWTIVAGLTIALVLLLAHIFWTVVQATRRRSLPGFGQARRERQLTPEELEQAADEAQATGDYIGAVRALFAASLLRIARAEERPFRKGITNRELLRVYRSTPLFAPLKTFADVVDAKWYGHEICQESDVRDCRESHARIRDLAERRTHAVSA